MSSYSYKVMSELNDWIVDPNKTVDARYIIDMKFLDGCEYRTSYGRQKGTHLVANRCSIVDHDNPVIIIDNCGYFIAVDKLRLFKDDQSDETVDLIEFIRLNRFDRSN